MLKINVLKITMVSALLGVLFMPVLAAAQDLPRGKWWRHTKIAEQLELTDQEKKSLDDRFVEARRKLIDLKASVEREKFELGYMLEQETLDEAGVKAQFQKFEKARAALATEHFDFALFTRKLIGVDRFQKLVTHYRMARRGEMRNHDNKGRRHGGKPHGDKPPRESSEE